MPPLPNPNARRRNSVDTSHLEEYTGPIDRRLTKLPNRQKFSAEAQLYWDTWANSEQAKWFTPTDWLALRVNVRLYQKFLDTDSHFVAAELRQREALLGATIGDRMRLKVHALRAQQKQNREVDTRATVEEDLELYAELNDE